MDTAEKDALGCEDWKWALFWIKVLDYQDEADLVELRFSFPEQAEDKFATGVSLKLFKEYEKLINATQFDGRAMQAPEWEPGRERQDVPQAPSLGCSPTPEEIGTRQREVMWKLRMMRRTMDWAVREYWGHQQLRSCPNTCGQHARSERMICKRGIDRLRGFVMLATNEAKAMCTKDTVWGALLKETAEVWSGTLNAERASQRRMWREFYQQTTPLKIQLGEALPTLPNGESPSYREHECAFVRERRRR